MMTSNVRDLAGMRTPYNEGDATFTEAELTSKEPFANFQNWFDSACEAACITEPNAMSLATATKDGKPSVRILLLKGFSKNGFTFYTNYNSRKGKELKENPHASLVFHWCNKFSCTDSWNRQVRVEGRVEQVSADESSSYFHSRPRPSQIGACISEQSSVIPGRHVLSEKQKEFEEKYLDESTEIPRPADWGGYLVVPDVIEFWQGQTNRIHDRIVFRRPAPGETIDPEMTHQGDDGWVYERLAP